MTTSGVGRCVASVGVKQLRVHCIVGVNPSERIHKQDLLIDCMCKYDIGQAVREDNMTHAVNYSELARRVRKFIEEKQFMLIGRCPTLMLMLSLLYKIINNQ